MCVVSLSLSLCLSLSISLQDPGGQTPGKRSGQATPPTIMAAPTHARLATAAPPQLTPPPQTPTHMQAPPPQPMSSGAFGQTSPPMQAPVQLTMMLDIPFHETGEEGSSKREAFKRDVEKDLAKASGLPAENFKITKLSAGSVIVDMTILPDPRGAIAPSAVARNLEQQAADPNSLLRSGKLTSKTQTIQVLDPQRPPPTPMAMAPPPPPMSTGSAGQSESESECEVVYNCAPPPSPKTHTQTQKRARTRTHTLKHMTVGSMRADSMGRSSPTGSVDSRNSMNSSRYSMNIINDINLERTQQLEEVCLSLSLSVRRCVCVYVRVCACMCVSISSTWILCVCDVWPQYTHTHTHTHTHAHTPEHVDRVDKMCVCVCMYIRIHVHIHIHIGLFVPCEYTHVHSYTRRHVWSA